LTLARAIFPAQESIFKTNDHDTRASFLNKKPYKNRPLWTSLLGGRKIDHSRVRISVAAADRMHPTGRRQLWTPDGAFKILNGLQTEIHRHFQTQNRRFWSNRTFGGGTSQNCCGSKVDPKGSPHFFSPRPTFGGSGKLTIAAPNSTRGPRRVPLYFGGSETMVEDFSLQETHSSTLTLTHWFITLRYLGLRLSGTEDASSTGTFFFFSFVLAFFFLFFYLFSVFFRAAEFRVGSRQSAINSRKERSTWVVYGLQSNRGFSTVPNRFQVMRRGIRLRGKGQSLWKLDQTAQKNP